MGTLIIIAGGLIGGGSALKKNFLSVWLWYINTIFALIPALSFTSPVSSMLNLPFLPPHLRTATAFSVLFLICLVILFKITEQVLPKPAEIEKYPVLPGKVIGAFCGFLTGCCYAAILVYLAGSVPILEGTISTKAFKAAGTKTLCRIAFGAALQTMPDEKACLKAMDALETSAPAPKQKESGPPAKTPQGKRDQIRTSDTSAQIQTTDQNTAAKKKIKHKKRKKKSFRQGPRKMEDSLQKPPTAETASQKAPPARPEETSTSSTVSP